MDECADSMTTVDTTPIHEHALKALEEADYALAYAEIKLDEVHLSDQITAEWLTKVLGGQIAGAKLLVLVGTRA